MRPLKKLNLYYMSKDQAKINENVTLNHTPNVEEVAIKKHYIVEAESGIFKNGKEYAKGTTVELNQQAAKNFIAAGDIKEV
jgi:hypothetical protein